MRLTRTGGGNIVGDSDPARVGFVGYPWHCAGRGEPFGRRGVCFT